MPKQPLQSEGGYAYVMVLVAVTVLAILASVSSVLVSYQVKHDKEMELLFRGQAYEQAIGAYYSASPPGKAPAYPQKLEDLLSDPRFLNRRYLRSLYPEPFGAGWSLVRGRDGGIVGVASQSREKPAMQDHFPPEAANFAGAAHYSDWIFIYHPKSGAQAAPAPLTP